MTLTRLPNETTEQYIARLEAAVAVKPSIGRVSFKVSEKGGVSVYGLGRFPVTLYKEQWIKLSELFPDILAFIDANDAQLKTKEAKEATTA